MEKEDGFVSYLLKEVLENSLGFLTGMGVTGFLSNYFETRSIKNLWGLAAKKTVVSKSEFEFMETAVSVTIGFFVLMLVKFLFRKKILPHLPTFKARFKSFIQEKVNFF